MGANLPCTTGSDCCNKDHQDIHVFRAKDPGERLPGMRLDLPVAVEQSMSAKEGWDPAAERPSRDCAAPPASARSQHTADDDNDHEPRELFVPPSVDSRTEGEAPDVGKAAEGEVEEGKETEEDLPLHVPPPQEEDETKAEECPGPGAAAAPTATTGSRFGDALAAAGRSPAQKDVSRFRENVEARSSPNPNLKEIHDLVLEFRLPDGSTRRVDFGKRKPPMGLDFAKDTPIPVHYVKPGGHAAELGVQVGWVVTRINGDNLEGLPFHEAMLLMTNAAAKVQSSVNGSSPYAYAVGPQPPPPSVPLPVPGRASRTPELPSDGAMQGGGLTVSFLLPDGSRRNVDFGLRKPPLGMDFDKSIPITVKKVKPGHHAEALGILPGWEITHLNDESVEGKTVMEIFNMMKQATLSQR